MLGLLGLYWATFLGEGKFKEIVVYTYFLFNLWNCGKLEIHALKFIPSNAEKELKIVRKIRVIMKLRPSLQLDGLQLKDTGQLENFINKKIAIK